MKSILKTLYPLAVASFAILPKEALYADNQMRISKLEAKMRDCSTSNARGTHGAKLANGAPQIDGYGFYVTADALLFQIAEGNNQFATLYPGGGNLLDIKEVFTNFDWDLGFRAGLGYYMGHDGWQTGLEFSYLQSNANNSVSASGLAQLNISDNIAAIPDSYSFISDHWNVHFYNLDWKLGKEFFVSKYLSFFPAFGVKSTWFYQNRKLNAVDVPVLLLNASSFADLYKIKDDFTGVGPLASLGGKFYFGKNFSFFGEANAAVLYAKNKSSFTYINEPTAINVTTGKLKKNHIAPYLALKLGLGYDTNLSDDQYNLGIKLSYENQYYGSANHMGNFQFWDNAYDISMQGVDLSFVLSF